MEEIIERVVLNSEEIEEVCRNLANQINIDYKGKRLLLVGVLKGSVPFLSCLMKYINVELMVDYVYVNSYKGHEKEMVIVHKDLDINFSGLDVLVVEDIIDTGFTLYKIIEMLKGKDVASCEIIVLLDKIENRKLGSIKPKYIGKIIPNEFVVGFGLDYKELYRNLPIIGVLNKNLYRGKR